MAVSRGKAKPQFRLAQFFVRQFLRIYKESRKGIISSRRVNQNVQASVCV